MPLFFGKVRSPVGDDQSQIARAGRIHAGKINFVDYAVAEREPDAAGGTECRAHARLRARSPARRNARPARGGAGSWSIHLCMLGPNSHCNTGPDQSAEG